MRLIPLLLRPTQLSAKNRLCAGGLASAKEMVAIFMSLAMMAVMYFSTDSALQAGNNLSPAITINPLGPLSLLLSSLFVMLTLAAAISAIGSLFLAKDLDLLLSSPITLPRFLAGRSLEVAVSTGWMVGVFGLPSLVALGEFFETGSAFFILAPLISFVFMALAVITGILCALTFAALSSPHKGRTVLFLFFIASLVLFFCSLNSPTLTLQTGGSPLDYQLATLNAAAQATWSPGYHWAVVVLDLRDGVLDTSLATISSALAILAAMWAAVILVARVGYVSAYGSLRGDTTSFKLNSRSGQTLSRILFPFLRSDRRALITKEYKLFARDITHTIQLTMLLAICFIYLYNFQALESPPEATPEVQLLWQMLLLLVNVGLSFLVVTSICSRFVFPSVSLEGASLWILQSAPVSMRNILRAKLLSWFMPMSIVSVVIFMSGAMAVGATEPLVLASGAIGFILAYGLVGMSIGFGALFAHFEWDYASQVSTTMGSFIFMALSLVFLAVNAVPITLMLGLYSFFPNILSSQSSPHLILCLGTIMLALLNYGCAAACLSIGSRSLKTR